MTLVFEPHFPLQVDCVSIEDRNWAYFPLSFPNNFHIVDYWVERLGNPIALVLRKVDSPSIIASLEGLKNIWYITLLITAGKHCAPWTFMAMEILSVVWNPSLKIDPQILGQQLYMI